MLKCAQTCFAECHFFCRQDLAIILSAVRSWATIGPALSEFARRSNLCAKIAAIA